MAFPLFDLPAEAVEQIIGCVDSRDDKRALRLVSKRSRSIVDSRVVSVKLDTREFLDQGLDQARLSSLVGAPWHLRTLHLHSLDDTGAAMLAAAHFPALQELKLSNLFLHPAVGRGRVASIFVMRHKNICLKDVGAASLAAGYWPALALLDLTCNCLSDACAVALSTAFWPSIQSVCLDWNLIGSGGKAALQARWPTAQFSFQSNLLPQ